MITMSDENKIVTDNDEIKEFQKEVMGKLDNPLVVHKKSDASYQEDASAYEMNQTHNEEAKPTLERHRFKKEPKKKGNSITVLLLVLILCAGVFAGLYYTNHLPFQKEKVTTTQAVTEESTTDIVQKYQGTIVIKDTYIFVNGLEVNGIEGLQKTIKYDEASPTAFEIIDEHANTDFLNYDVYPLLTDLGFFGDKTVVTHIDKTGLMAQEELDAIAEEEAAANAAEEAATATTEEVTEAETEPVSE